MMKCKSKKYKQHEDIKLGIIAIVAMISIITIINITSPSIEGAYPITYTKQHNYIEKTFYPKLELAADRVECTMEGLKQCQEYYQPWEYSTTTTTINYKQCVWYVQRQCAEAPLFYPHPLS